MLNTTNTAMSEERFAEYCDYIAANRLTKHERHLLREWLQAGHSVYETVESRYLTGPAYPPMDFIDAYRLDRSLGKAMSGMSREERIAYLKAYMGYEEEPSSHYTRHIEKEVSMLWSFIASEGLCDEAHEYIENIKDYFDPNKWFFEEADK